MAQSVEEETISFPIQCQSDRDGLNGTIVYDKETYGMPLALPHTQAQSVEEETISFPIQCESDRDGLNGTIVYGKETYSMPLTHQHHHIGAQLSFAVNSTIFQHIDIPAETLLSPNQPLASQDGCNQRLTHISIDLGETECRVPSPWWMNGQWKAGLTIMLLLVLVYTIYSDMV